MTKHVSSLKTVENLLSCEIAVLPLNLNALRMFDAAARRLNFRLAAEELNITQGAVAQQVRSLEKRLGVRLFQRKARGLELTADGEAFHPPIRRALSLIEDATWQLRPDGLALTVSVPPSFASKWMVPKLGKFAAEHPDVRIETIASEKIATFDGDGIDLAVRQGHPPAGDGLVARLIARLELSAVCSPSHLTAGSDQRSAADFRAERLIQDGHKSWERLFLEAGLIAEAPYLQFNQTALAMEAAANGQGIALVPRLLLTEDLAAGRLKELWRTSADDPAGYYAVWPRGSRTAAPLEAFVNWLVQEAGACA
ncbi:MAG: LysR substrate-binding domain-containing protein [Pseudomonadota bacterium]